MKSSLKQLVCKPVVIVILDGVWENKFWENEKLILKC